MAKRVGLNSERLAAVRALRTVKGRREQKRFAFEGGTLLGEAVTAGFPLAEIYATEDAYDSEPLLRELDSAGTPVLLLDERVAKGLSDLQTPSGIVAVAPVRLDDVGQLLRQGSPLLVLADLNDPANAGTLLRSAEAFGARATAFGRLGVDPYHPKVVRGAMGALFRIHVGITEPAEMNQAATTLNVRVIGLSARGDPFSDEGLQHPFALVVGHEKRGLGRWESFCERVLAIPMRGRSESLSAGVAGSIALYEAQRSTFVKRVSRS
jgi:TrmH family RNA methyltransferase